MESAKSTDPRTIFIRGISFSVDDAQLSEHFSSIGPVRHAFLVKTKDGQKHKGFGFVHYALEDDAERAIEELNGTDLAGRKIHVESAVKRAPLEQRKTKKKPTTAADDDNADNDDDGSDDDDADDDSSKKAKATEQQQQQQRDNHRQDTSNIKKKGSEKHVLLQTVALGGLSSADIDAAVAFCKSLGHVEAIESPAPQSIIRQYKLVQDGCTGEVLLLRYPSIKDAMNAVAALHGKSLPKELAGLKKRGKKHTASGHTANLWARQVSGEGLHMKKWRVIVRNLPFKATESDIRKAFTPAGFVWEVTMPVKVDGRPRGFAFVGFTCKSHAERGIKIVNGTKIAGRVVAVDWAVAKSDYEHGIVVGGDSEKKQDDDVHVDDDSGSDDDDQKTQQPKKILGQHDDEDVADMDIEEERGMFNSVIDDILGRKEENNDDDDDNEEDNNDGSDDDSDDDSDDTSNDENDADHNKQQDSDNDNDAVAQIKRRAEQLSQRLDPRNQQPKDQQQQGVTDATVFVRGLALDTTKEQLFDAMRSFGPLRSCRLVMSKQTGKPKGTAFVDYKYADSAKAAATASEKARHKQGPGVVVAGKKIEVDMALGVDAARQLAKEKSIAIEGGKDKRNLYLAKEGLILEGTTAWEDLSTSDRAKRKRAQEDSRLKLKSPNFCVSKTRLNVRNVPRTWDEKKLKALFIAAVKERAVKANPKIVQVKILKEDEGKGANVAGRSKGIAFVEFSDHEHALCALRQLNNNPETWSKDHRPIVEFAIDNVKALKLREKRMAQSNSKGSGGGDDGHGGDNENDGGKGKRKKKKGKKAKDDGDEDGGDDEPKSKRKLRQERRAMLKKMQRQQQGKQRDGDDGDGGEEKSKSKRRREQRKRKKDGDGDGGHEVVKKQKSDVVNEDKVRKRKMREDSLLDAIASAGVEEGRVVAGKKKNQGGAKRDDGQTKKKRWFE